MLGRLFGFGQPADDGQVHIVDPATVKAWFEAGEAVIVDVREPNEYVAEHIPGAKLVPLSAFDPAQIPPHAGKKLVLHCRSGNRCGMAAMRLVQSGFTGEINRLQGGMFGWRSVGGRIESGAAR
jgi:rhodanese-related sulfurtransferase